MRWLRTRYHATPPPVPRTKTSAPRIAASFPIGSGSRESSRRGSAALLRARVFALDLDFFESTRVSAGLSSSSSSTGESESWASVAGRAAEAAPTPEDGSSTRPRGPELAPAGSPAKFRTGAEPAMGGAPKFDGAPPKFDGAPPKFDGAPPKFDGAPP